jgi:(2Fe-2S) ferredoxin
MAVNNIPNNSVNPNVQRMYQQVNQAQVTNSVQSMTDGGRRRKKRKSKKRRKSRRRGI